MTLYYFKKVKVKSNSISQNWVIIWDLHSFIYYNLFIYIYIYITNTFLFYWIEILKKKYF